MSRGDNDNTTWAESLDDFKPDYTPVKCFSLLMFYKLDGRKSNMVIDNFISIVNLTYCVYSPKEGRYYIKVYPDDIPLWLVMFYDPNGSWDSYDTYLNTLRSRLADGNVYILYTPEQIADTTAMLERLYKSRFSKLGKVPYPTYIKLADQSLRLEDYRDYGKNLTGFRTVCRQFELRIEELWKSCYKN